MQTFVVFCLFKQVMCILVFTYNKKKKKERKEESCNPLYRCLFMWPTPCLKISCLPFVSKITAQLLLPAPPPPPSPQPPLNPPPSALPPPLNCPWKNITCPPTPLEKAPPAPHSVDVIQSLHALQTYAHEVFYFAASVFSNTRILWCTVYVGWEKKSSNRAIWTV